MSVNIEELIAEVDRFTAETKDQLEQFRLRFLSKKGKLAELFAEMKQVLPEERKNFGLRVNELKNKAEEKLRLFNEQFTESTSTTVNNLDLTLPGEPIKTGSRHPVSIVRNRIVEIFQKIGYTVAEAGEIEDDWHNFTALNFPPEHPARDMQDTFFMDDEWGMALRTHTSSVQVRVMESSRPPIRVVAPGRV